MAREGATRLRRCILAVLGMLVAALAIAAPAASAAPAAPAAPAVSNTTIVGDCSAEKAFGFVCIDWARSSNSAGASVVKPYRCTVYNTGTHTDIVGPFVYGWKTTNLPVQKSWDPNYSIPPGGNHAFDCSSVFTSWGYEYPGMYLNTYIGSNGGAEAFTSYSSSVV